MTVDVGAWIQWLHPPPTEGGGGLPQLVFWSFPSIRPIPRPQNPRFLRSDGSSAPPPRLSRCRVSPQAEYEVTPDEKRKECGEDLVNKYFNSKVSAAVGAPPLGGCPPPGGDQQLPLPLWFRLLKHDSL